MLVSLSVGLLCGCTVHLEPPGQPTCTEEDPRCPAGYECVQGLCRPGGAGDSWAGEALDLGTRDGPRGEKATAKCGNHTIEPGEDCEGTNLNNKSCTDLCYAGGTLRCSSCAFDIDECTVPTSWVLIKAKKVTFTMGSPETEIGRDKGETQRKVTLTHSFHIFPTEVSQEQFTSKLGYNPSYIPSQGHPVEEVVWSEAAAFCNKLSEEQGLEKCYTVDKTECPSFMDPCTNSGNEAACKQVRCTVLKVNPKYNTSAVTLYDCPGYRLPAEAEWEYAYRAGTTTATYAGNLTAPGGNDPLAEKIAWYYCNSNKGKTHSVLSRKRPNAFCLFDMAGNVWEFTNDYWQEDNGSSPVTDPTGPSGGIFKVTRGGSHYELARDLRAARRRERYPFMSNVNTGFRCVRTSFD